MSSFSLSKESILYSRIGDSRPLGKGSLLHFPGELDGYAMQVLCLSLFPLPSAIPASLFSFANSIGESFASCAPTVRKLNERLQLCSPPLQPAMLSPLSVCLSPRNCLFYKFIIGTTLRRNCQTCSCLQNSFPWFTCARVSLLSIARSLEASLLARVGKFWLFEKCCLIFVEENLLKIYSFFLFYPLVRNSRDTLCEKRMTEDIAEGCSLLPTFNTGNAGAAKVIAMWQPPVRDLVRQICPAVG